VDWFHGAALVLTGLLAGFVNTLAGGGSTLTLPVLEWVIGSPGAANATNRIGLLFQNAVAVAGFQTGRKVAYRLALRLSVPSVAGAILGAWIATVLQPGTMRVALSTAVALVAVSALFRTPRTPRLQSPWLELVFFAIGIYMGFLQAGAGFALLACLVGGLGLDLVRANAVKVTIVLVVTVPALIVFGLRSELHVVVGLLLAGGMMVGAWIASRLAVLKGARWIRWVVVAAALGAIVKLMLFPSGPR